ncbi:MAG: PH domain-containing protein [Promethearchaeota archaeon]|nr:MAG: PH domain-containing protein [Candidatus Lokiarchaeota archaeon]
MEKSPKNQSEFPLPSLHEDQLEFPNLSPQQSEWLRLSQKYFQLNANETVLTVLQRNTKSYYAPRLFRGSTFIAIYMILRYLILYNEIQSSTIFTNIVNWILILWGIYFGIALLVGRGFVHGHLYIITSKRIILIRKFLGIMFREIEYKRITDLVLQQSMWGRVFDFGNLMPVTAGIEMNALKMGMYSIEGIPKVFEIRNLVITQIQYIQAQLLEEYKKIGPATDTSVEKQER